MVTLVEFIPLLFDFRSYYFVQYSKAVSFFFSYIVFLIIAALKSSDEIDRFSYNGGVVWNRFCRFLIDNVS